MKKKEVRGSISGIRGVIYTYDFISNSYHVSSLMVGKNNIMYVHYTHCYAKRKENKK